MLVMRPIRHEHLDQLLELAGAATFGLTTLPQDRKLLAGRISDSIRAFEEIRGSPRGESYLLVMEDTEGGRIVGTSGIVSKAGGFEPFYAYRIETSIHHSDMLDVHKQIPTLHLVEEHNGPCEIGSLFLDPSYRKSGAGRALSLSRFLFMAEHPDHFDPVVIAEMRGVIDKAGRSPFWDAIGSHFFAIDFPSADYLSIVNKRFIADLMPKHPIYLPLLPFSAQQVVGKVHQNTVPARKLLESEGFSFSEMVDIFEAGPILSCPREEIRSVRESVRAEVVEVTDRTIDSENFLISNVDLDFRACSGRVDVREPQRVCLHGQTADALGIKVGQTVRFVTLRPARHEKDDH